MLSHLKMKPEVEEPKRQSSGSRILERRPLLLQLCLKRNVNVYLFIFLFARGLSTCLVTPHPIMQVPNGRNTSFVLQEPCRMPPWWKELFSQRGTNRVVNVWQKENTIKQQMLINQVFTTHPFNFNPSYALNSQQWLEKRICLWNSSIAGSTAALNNTGFKVHLKSYLTTVLTSQCKLHWK